MFRTYYALAVGKVQPDGINMKVIELPDPPSKEQEEALIRGDVQAANLYLPNFLRRKLQNAPIVGLATEWKSTMKGNGVFVRTQGPVKTPKDLEGKLIATHQGLHAIHQYLLRRVYSVDDKKLRWESYPQEKLLDALLSGKADAVVLLDHFFFRGEVADGVTCLYTDGEAWKKLHGFDELIKHMVAAREDLLAQNPGIKETLLRAFPSFVRVQRISSGRDRRWLYRPLRWRQGSSAGFGALSAHRIYLHGKGTAAGAGGDGVTRRSGTDPAHGAGRNPFRGVTMVLTATL